MTYEEFKSKTHVRAGILNKNYSVFIKLPQSYIDNSDQENIGVAPHVIFEPNLKKAGYFANSITISKVFSNEIEVEFIVSEPFLHRFYQKIITVDGAQIIEKEQ